jgi:hypothetical protein
MRGSTCAKTCSYSLSTFLAGTAGEDPLIWLSHQSRIRHVELILNEVDTILHLDSSESNNPSQDDELMQELEELAGSKAKDN